MKTIIKVFVATALTFSLSSVYAQEETGVVKSRSNIKTNRGDENARQTADVRKGWNGLTSENIVKVEKVGDNVQISFPSNIAFVISAKGTEIKEVTTKNMKAKPGDPIPGVGVNLGRKPGGSTQMRTPLTNGNQFEFPKKLADGDYSLTFSLPSGTTVTFDISKADNMFSITNQTVGN